MRHLAQLALAAGLVVGCSGDEAGGPNPPAPPAPETASVTTPLVPPAVWIPSSVTIRPGGTVTFKNADGSPAVHNVVSTSNAWPVATIDPGETFDLKLPNAGQYPFQCTLHPGMNGVITVK